MVAAASAEISSSEEVIKQRIRENLKFFEDMGISREFLEFANSEYKLWVGDDEAELRYCRKRSSSNQNAIRAYTGRIASEDQQVAALKRAEELQRDLKSHHPSFIKPMVRSHVSGCFWLGLPLQFCQNYLPSGELRMTLEDEEGMEHDVLYLGRKTGLSGGWKGFALTHGLEDGDVLIFELSQPARFKVHIVKAIDEESHGTDEEDANSATTVVKPEKSKSKKNDQHPRTHTAKKEGRPAKRAH